MTRVLVVAHSAALGGAELGLLRYLACRPPFDLQVLLLEDGPLGDRFRALDVPVLLPPRRGAGATLRTLAREVRRPGTVVLSATLRAATLVGLVQPRGARHLLYLQDLLHGGYFGRAKVLLATGFTVRRAAGIMVNSEATRRSLPRSVRRRAAWVVYSPSGVGEATPAPAPRTPGTGVLRPLYLGRVAPWKGPDLFIEACERVTRRDPTAIARATMAGGSFFGERDYRRGVERRAAAARTPIEVLDHQESVDELFARCNVLVHTSTTPEPFGQVVVQAMARGVLVVAPDAGGPRETIRDGETGFLYEMGDPDSLAEVLLAVRRDPRTAAEVARRGRAAAARFSDRRVAALIDGAVADFARHGVRQRAVGA